MTTYRKIQQSYEARQYDGTEKSVEAIGELIGMNRVSVVNKGLVNAAPQVVVHATLGSVALAMKDYVVVAAAEHTVHVYPEPAFIASFEETDASLMDVSDGDAVVVVDAIAAGIGINDTTIDASPSIG